MPHGISLCIDCLQSVYRSRKEDAPMIQSEVIGLRLFLFDQSCTITLYANIECNVAYICYGATWEKGK